MPLLTYHGEKDWPGLRYWRPLDINKSELMIVPFWLRVPLALVGELHRTAGIPSSVVVDVEAAPAQPVCVELEGRKGRVVELHARCC